MVISGQGEKGHGDMTAERVLAEYPLRFIQQCVRQRQLYWTCHINRRLQGRFIAR